MREQEQRRDHSNLKTYRQLRIGREIDVHHTQAGVKDVNQLATDGGQRLPPWGLKTHQDRLGRFCEQGVQGRRSDKRHCIDQLMRSRLGDSRRHFPCLLWFIRQCIDTAAATGGTSHSSTRSINCEITNAASTSKFYGFTSSGPSLQVASPAVSLGYDSFPHMIAEYGGETQS